MNLVHVGNLKWKTLSIVLMCSISSIFISSHFPDSLSDSPISNSAAIRKIDSWPLNFLEKFGVQTDIKLFDFFLLTVLGYFLISRYENCGRVKLFQISIMVFPLFLVISTYQSAFSIAALILSTQNLKNVTKTKLRSLPALFIAFLFAPATTTIVLVVGYVVSNIIDNLRYRTVINWLLVIATIVIVVDPSSSNMSLEVATSLTASILIIGIMNRRFALTPSVREVIGETDKETLKRMTMIYSFLVSWVFLGTDVDLYLLSTIFGVHLVVLSIKNRFDDLFLGIKLFLLPTAAFIYLISQSKYHIYGALISLLSLNIDLTWLRRSSGRNPNS